MNTTFHCIFCDSEFNTERGLKSHMTRAHNDVNPNNVCTKCHKQLTSRTNRDKHMKTCKVDVSTVIVPTPEPPKNDLVIETMKELVKEVKFLKEHQQPHTIINNHNNYNTTNNNNYNSGHTYTQHNNNNNQTNILIDNLKPITSKGICEALKQIFDDALREKRLLTSNKDLSLKMSNSSLRDSLLTTDASRGVAHWKDGDKDNEHIKDPQCAILSTKMYNALSENIADVMGEYPEYIDKLSDSINEDTGYERFSEINRSKQVLKSLTNEEFLKTVGKGLSKMAITPAVKQSYNIEKFLTILRTLYITKPYIFMLQNAYGIGSSVKKALEIYGNFTVDDEEISLDDDDKKKITIPLSSFFELVKECFVSANCTSIFFMHYLECDINYEFIKKFLESKEIAKENALKFKKWITEEDIDDPSFEKNMYKMLSIRC